MQNAKVNEMSMGISSLHVSLINAKSNQLNIKKAFDAVQDFNKMLTLITDGPFLQFSCFFKIIFLPQRTLQRVST